ncbi:MAG: hypothetical protein O3A26_04310 [Proteobacteria bacterium]|jgi:hypothetical protein|nr:hypothetical protein [Pseudomonadota bacterium]MDA0972015.1 hypothetical protein [Pseudomonadota bacterium]MDA0996096.1 hypothetical protein [Pseudomonadota bacterium]
MTPQQLLLLMGSLMIGMAIAKKSLSKQDKYLKIALYAFGSGFIVACVLWK